MIIRYAIAILMLAFLGQPVWSEAAESFDSWQYSASVHGAYTRFDSSVVRENAFYAGVNLAADYLDDSRIAGGFNHTLVNTEGGGEITEDMGYITGTHALYPDMLPGKLSLQLAVFFGENEVLSRSSSTIPVISRGHGRKSGMGSTQFSYRSDFTSLYTRVGLLNYAKTWNVELAYAWSEYNGEDADDTNQFNQLSPALGFGWNESFDWLLIRPYWIAVDESIAEEDEYAALELIYTHWLRDASVGELNSISLKVLGGERLFAVDADAGVVYSLSDKQTGSLALSVEWKVTESMQSLLHFAYEKYNNPLLQNDYDSMLVFLSINTTL